MKKKSVQVIILFLLVSMVLCGCGTPLFEVTEEEEAVIVRYAAYVLAKHNVYQKDGMVAVSQSLLEEDSGETDSGTEDSTQILTDDTETETESEAETAEAQTGSAETAQTNEEADDTLSIAEAAGYEGQLKITYTGFTVVDNFQEGKAFSLDAHAGYEFIVAQFTAENITDEALDVDMMSKNLTFRVSYDGSKWVKEDVTLLLTDLSTFTGSVEAGQSVDLVLLFEIPEEDTVSMEELSFSVDKDGTNYRIAP
jgi:hypothetical protein